MADPLVPPLLPIFDPGSGLQTFQAGLNASTPTSGISPQYQTILDNIKAQQNYDEANGTSQAISLAGRRGLAGSSMEQFGVQNAISEAAKASRDAQSNVLLANEQRNQQLRELQAQALFARSQLGDQTAMQLYQLDLEKLLGQQGIDVARQNIDISRQIAEKQARNNLYSSGISAIIPSLLGMGGGGGDGGGGGPFSGFGGGGALANLFGGASTPLGRFFMGGGGGSATAGATAGPGLSGNLSLLPSGGNPFVPGVGTGAIGGAVPGPYSALQAGGFGGAAAGTGLGFLGSALGRQTFGGGNDVGGAVGGGLGYLIGGPMGAGAGSFLGVGAQRLGENIYQQAQNKLGNTAASYIKPIVDPVGSVKSISKAVKKVFPF